KLVILAASHRLSPFLCGFGDVLGMHDAGPAPAGSLFHSQAGEFVPIPIAVRVGPLGIRHPNYLRRELDEGAIARFTLQRIQLFWPSDDQLFRERRRYQSQLAAQLDNLSLKSRDLLEMMSFLCASDWARHENPGEF